MMFAQYQEPLPGKFFVRFDPDMNIKIAFWPVSHGLAVLPQTDFRTVIYTGWDLELDRLRFALCTATATDRAGLFRNLACRTAGFAASA